MIRERVLAGLARAKEQGISLGRRRLEDSDAAKVAAIKRALDAVMAPAQAFGEGWWLSPV
jgi:DNA invertase Pin-like site-specific DNA recombinase